MAWLAPPPPFITSAATSVLLLLLAAGLAGTECSASLSMTAGTNHKRNALAKVTHAHKHKNSCKIQENHGDRPGDSTVAGYVCFFSHKTLKLMKKVLKPLNLYGLIIFCLKWRKTNCSEHHVKGGVLEPHGRECLSGSDSLHQSVLPAKKQESGVRTQATFICSLHHHN